MHGWDTGVWKVESSNSIHFVLGNLGPLERWEIGLLLTHWVRLSEEGPRESLSHESRLPWEVSGYCGAWAEGAVTLVPKACLESEDALHWCGVDSSKSTWQTNGHQIGRCPDWGRRELGCPAETEKSPVLSNVGVLHSLEEVALLLFDWHFFMRLLTFDKRQFIFSFFFLPFIFWPLETRSYTVVQAGPESMVHLL